MTDLEQNLEHFLPKVAKGAGIVFIGSILGRVAGYLFRIVVARGLGPEEYGLISLGIATISMIGLFTSLGLQKGVTRYVSLYKGRGDKEGIKGTITSSLKMLFPLRLLLGIALFLFSEWISINIFQEPSLSLVLKIMAAAIVIRAFKLPFNSAIQAFQRMDYLVYSNNISVYFSRVGLAALLVLLGYGVLGVAFAFVVAIAIGTIVSFYLLQRKVFPVIKSKVGASKMGKELFLYSWPLMITGVAGFITGWVDTLMLGWFKNAEVVGFYNAARPTAQLLGAAPHAFGTIFFPVLSELHGRGKEKEMEEVFHTVTKWVLIIALPIAILLILLSPQILKLLFGSTYVVASTALGILVTGFLFSNYFMTSRRLLETVGFTKLLLYISSITALLNLVLNYLMIPLLGMEGAAIATGTSVAIGGILAGSMTKRKTGFLPITEDVGKVVVAGLGALFPLLIVPVFQFLEKTILVIASTSLIYLSLYLVLLALLNSFDSKDLVVLRAIEERTGLNLDPLINIVKKLS